MKKVIKLMSGIVLAFTVMVLGNSVSHAEEMKNNVTIINSEFNMMHDGAVEGYNEVPSTMNEIDNLDIDNNISRGNVTRSDISQGVMNVVERARMIYNNTWTPKKDIYSNKFSGGFTLKAGETRHGLPYAQPWYTGGYVGHDISLDEFNALANNTNSRLYTTAEPQGGIFYGTDCSGFVSFCMGHGRMTCRDMAASSSYTKKGKVDFNSIEVGDIINRANSGNDHVLVIIGKNGDKIYTLEQTVPDTKKREMTFEDLKTKYYDTGYEIYRYNKIDNVKSGNSTMGSIGKVAADGSEKIVSGLAEFQQWIRSRFGVSIYVDGIYTAKCGKGMTRAWQKLMNEIYGANLSVDGDYGNMSNQAAVNYNPTLTKGQYSDLTKLIQGVLKYKYNYSVNSVDGILGINTADMITNFQKDSNIVVTGNINPETLMLMFNK